MLSAVSALPIRIPIDCHRAAGIYSHKEKTCVSVSEGWQFGSRYSGKTTLGADPKMKLAALFIIDAALEEPESELTKGQAKAGIARNQG